MTSTSLQNKILKLRASPREYQIYRAALEWDVTDPIVIEKRDDLKSELRWRELLEPFSHQVTNLITFCRRLPVTLIADDVGLGKTISAGLIASELIARGRLTRLLIVCPKLLGPQWQEELRTKFDIDAEIAVGKSLLKAEPRDVGAVITTYSSARIHLEKIPPDRYEMLILDEAHKLRNLYGVEKRPQVAQRFYDALQERRFRFVLMLTATPIHNRLWDLYSLVDLLTVARGHQNPFGSEGMFARKFIADNRESARHLKQEAKEEFRSIVYSYMSRIRRGDAKLYFPDRMVQMHKVEPTPSELQLIAAISRPIQKLNRLAQISILQALSSSPEALSSQLGNMARNGTIAVDLANTVRAIVVGMPASAKLLGLGALMKQLALENSQRWRLVVFTGRIETQTTIQNFLERSGLKVGIINGSSGARNQDTLAKFRRDPPEVHVIVSTEAGSEGINLQVANVLVNYDLPWNPMIVEQRIGRVQRLASEHKNVSIFNVMLRGTFEEYIVGRLMEKLQMASHAIGDIEALLEASGMDDEGNESGFEERIRELVIAALAGKDVTEATRREELSIEEAKKTLEAEEANINSMLGSMDGAQYVGPRAPALPNAHHSMNEREFVVAALATLGARVSQREDGLFCVDGDNGRELIRFDDDVSYNLRSTLYRPGSPAFSQLVDRVVATGVHDVEDVDRDPTAACKLLAQRWLASFEAIPKALHVTGVRRCFDGTAVILVRASVAHDSYERLLDVQCTPSNHKIDVGPSGLSPLSRLIEDPKNVGIRADNLVAAATEDEAVSEFCRFYLERREQEVKAAVGDERKQRKLKDEFTPRLDMTLVGLHGRVHRELELEVTYGLGTEHEYRSSLLVQPFTSTMLNQPPLARCSKSGRTVPHTCLVRCEISGALVLRHLLEKSEVSGRYALPEFIAKCALSGKRALRDELEVSAASGRLVSSALLRSSSLSGKRAEPEFLGRCSFTGSEVLLTELATSQLSGKAYRVDEQMQSIVSEKRGHKQEFVICHETKLPVGSIEAETCAVTGHAVAPGILTRCEVTGKRVLPSELERSAVSGKRVLKKLLVRSSLSGAPAIEAEAIRSLAGRFCLPVESKLCTWSGAQVHPDDLRVCDLTGLSFSSEFSTTDNKPRLRPLVDLLDGMRRTADETALWPAVLDKATKVLKSNRCTVDSAVVSPDRQNLAVCAELRTLLGFRTQHVGFVFSISERSIIGRVPKGRRESTGWIRTK